MADMTIPVSWTKYDSGPDYVTYKRTDHTSEVPELVKFKRRPVSGGLSHYQVLGVVGLSDQVDGETRNTLLDISIRNVSGQLSTRVASMLGELGTLIGSAGFADDATVELDIPL